MGEFIKSVTKDTVIDTMLEFLTTGAIDFVKEQGLSLVKEQALTLGISAVPILGQAVTNYRTNRAIKNLEIQVKQLQEYKDILQTNLVNMSTEFKEDLDKIYIYMLERTIEEKQDEKIQYFTDSFVRLTHHQSIDMDITYIYYDTLSQMTLLDIKVLLEMQRGAFYYYQNPDSEPIIGRDITGEQYRAIKSNLERLGLVENELTKKLTKDVEALLTPLEEFRESILAIEALLDKGQGKLRGLKHKSKSKVPKFKATDKLVLSRFGEEMIAFFSKLD